MMKKPLVLAAIGVIVGVVVALALFMFVFGGKKGAAVAAGPTPTPTVVVVPGKVGPHLTLDDRIFNLVNTPALYLKMQAVIEFETTDPRWVKALAACDKARLDGDGPSYVSAVPAGGSARVVAPQTADPKPAACEAAATKLQDDFQNGIGNGRQLVEDAVTTIVTSKTAAQVGTTAGKEQLKAEITKAVERLLPEKHVTRVLFLDFITQ